MRRGCSGGPADINLLWLVSEVWCVALGFCTAFFLFRLMAIVCDGWGIVFFWLNADVEFKWNQTLLDSLKGVILLWRILQATEATPPIFLFTSADVWHGIALKWQFAVQILHRLQTTLVCVLAYIMSVYKSPFHRQSKVSPWADKYVPVKQRWRIKNQKDSNI